MLISLRRCRLVGAMALACFASACVTTSNRMKPETFNAMKSAEIFIVRAQQEIGVRITAHPVHADQYRAGGVYVHLPVRGGGGGGGGGVAVAGIMIFAAIAIAVSNSIKQKKADKWIAPVREAVPDAGIEEQLKGAIDSSFRSIDWIKPVPVPILDDTKSVVLEEKLYTSKADAVGIVTPYYQFNYSMTTLRVGMYFELFSASEALTKVVGKSQSQPIPYYAVHRFWDVSIPSDQRGEEEAHAAYWSAENGKRTRAALAEGVEFAAAQIHETISDPQNYQSSQIVMQKPRAIPKASNSFKTMEERNNWYAIRFGEVEEKWNNQGGETSADSMKRELDALAAECRIAAIAAKPEVSQKDEGCAVKLTLAKSVAGAPRHYQKAALTPRISRFRLKPNAEGYRRLDTQEIAVLFKDAYIENYPGHWQIEFSAGRKWEGIQSNWSVVEGYGTWTAKNGMHCIEVENISSTWANYDEKSCYQVWVDEEAGKIRMIDPTVVSAWVLAKENAFAEIARLQGTISNSQNDKPSQIVMQKPRAIPKVANSFKTVEERNNWYAIRFGEVEEKWYGRGGETSVDSMTKELSALADECHAATIKDKTTAAANDEGCVVKVVLEKTATAKSGPPPPRFAEAHRAKAARQVAEEAQRVEAARIESSKNQQTAILTPEALPKSPDTIARFDNTQRHSGAKSIRTTEETLPNKIASLPSQSLKEKTNSSSYWSNTTWRSVDKDWRIKIEYSEYGDYYDAELYNNGNEMFCSGDVFKSGQIETSICTGSGYNDRQIEGTVFEIFLEDNGNQGGARFVFENKRRNRTK